MPNFDDYLIVSEFPENSVERMVVTFRGWPDAGDAATATLNYLLTTFNAEKFAEIDPEGVFQLRPGATALHARQGRHAAPAMASQRVLPLAG